MLVLAIDPSGSFYEGKGTTGWALFESTNRELLDFGDVKAENFDKSSEYFRAVAALLRPDIHVVIEDYLLYANKAAQQINSRMETPKLIGYLQMCCSDLEIPYKMQMASKVKKRWADSILYYHGIIYRKGPGYAWYANNRRTNDHERDAMRHALHYIAFTLKEKPVWQTKNINDTKNY